MKNARIERIMNVRARSLEAARTALANAEAILGEKREALSSAQAAWLNTASLPAPATVSDLAINREPLIDLEAVILRTADACALAEQSVCERREEVLAAQFELRKIERWSEREGARARDEEGRVERRRNDESVSRARAAGE